MCIGRCSRFVGIILVFLALVSIAASTFLLFPNLTVTYLWRGLITRQAFQLPGLWGGGIMVLLAAIQIITAGSKINWFGCYGSCWHMFLSILLSVMALFGSVLCFAISAGGLLNGPLCLYNVLLPNRTKIQLWDYPFAGFDNMAFNNSVPNYLEDRSLWDSVCIEPSGVVVWNIHFFSILLVISTLEIFLSLIQIINGFFGCLCGLCDEKSVTSS
uniref:Transmembrane 4 L6 family member 19 n=1 Tax=Geotrypetes seraphini TaxID=260995 RepID=A0A6P8SBW5_GEOSA|nr:transmembrane 4 L6 family member 19 [Geotrypetes seraphini]